jgi:hypothetical protein
LFNIITKCICSFSDLKVRKQIDFSQERTSAGEEGQCRTGPIYQCEKKEGRALEEGRDPKEGGGRGPEKGDGGDADVR